MTFAAQATVNPREVCKCGEFCDDMKGAPHSEHSHFVGSTIYEHKWSSDSQAASEPKQSEPSQRGAA